MKIECTFEELEEYVDKRTFDLRNELENLKTDNNYLVKANTELQKKNQELNCHSHDMTEVIAQAMSDTARYYIVRNRYLAQELCKTLKRLFPDNKILQIKVLRQVSGVSLKKAKEFIEGETYDLPNLTFTEPYFH